MALDIRAHPHIGSDIPWRRVEHYVLRVTDFVFYGTVEGDAVQAPPDGAALGYLLVESPALRAPSVLPIDLAPDFRNAWAALRERGIGPEEECVVVYTGPRGFMPRPVPVLRIAVYPRGYVQGLYRAIMEQEPAPQVAPLAAWGPA